MLTSLGVLKCDASAFLITRGLQIISRELEFSDIRQHMHLHKEVKINIPQRHYTDAK